MATDTWLFKIEVYALTDPSKKETYYTGAGNNQFIFDTKTKVEEAGLQLKARNSFMASNPGVLRDSLKDIHAYVKAGPTAPGRDWIYIT